jgi:SAM-dependent methyltransferase
MRGVYRITKASKQRYSALVHTYAEGQDVVELGVGLESLFPALSAHCRSFRGIDISPVAVQEAAARFQPLIDPGRHGFLVANAEDTRLPEKSASLVFGSGIVHHLDTQKLVAELRRLIAPGGRAVFFEPLGYNPLINLFRLITPGMRSADEHPLLESDLEIFRGAFKEVTVSYFHLSSLALIPLCRGNLFEKFYRPLEAFDAWLFSKMTTIRKYGWVVVIDCHDPIPHAAING